MSEETMVKKHAMTDEERQQLAEKLDEELDIYIRSLGKKTYSDGWPEDRWEEEMEKHPFFMTKSPAVGQDLPPLLQGIQQLKYDEEENSPEELASTYKEDGNFNFKCKKYRVAVISYTEGLRHLRDQCKDNDLKAQLYNNRAAAHFFLKNYRSCLKDCQAALDLKKPYVKTQIRAAHCCLHLNLHEDCIRMCDEILADFPSNTEVLDLRTNAVSSNKLKERNERKQAVSKRKTEEEEKELMNALEERGIRILKKGRVFQLADVEPQSSEVLRSRLHLEDGRLVWPVIFLYPEHQITDFIQEFPEDCTFEAQINVMFNNPPEWDQEKKYKAPALQVYFEEHRTGKLCPVPTSNTLLQTLSSERFLVQAGTPCFIIFVAGSDAEKQYITNR